MRTEPVTQGREPAGRASECPHVNPDPGVSTPGASGGRQRLAFLGALGLFVAWLGWLAYLVVTTRTPVVLSRPQFLVSAVDVVARIDQVGDGPQQLTVQRVLWSGAEEGRKLEGTAITVTNLDRCAGWTGSGEYLVPLIPDGAPGRYQVPATPRSPGFEPAPRTEASRPHIYPATPQTLRQHATIAKP